MGIQQTGKLHAKFEAQQITERFRKQEFVIQLEPNSRYPQFVSFQLTGDRCGQIDEFQVGDEISVEFTLRGREWTSPKGSRRLHPGNTGRRVTHEAIKYDGVGPDS